MKHSMMVTPETLDDVGPFFAERMRELGLIGSDVEAMTGVSYRTAHDFGTRKCVPKLTTLALVCGALGLEIEIREAKPNEGTLQGLP